MKTPFPVVLLSVFCLSGFIGLAGAEDVLDEEEVQRCIKTSQELKQGETDLLAYRQQIDSAVEELEAASLKLENDKVYLERAESKYRTCMDNTQGFHDALVAQFCDPHESQYNSELRSHQRRENNLRNNAREIERRKEHYNHIARQFQAIAQAYYAGCLGRKVPDELYSQYCTDISSGFCDSFGSTQ